jgi:hypothetical protein
MAGSYIATEIDREYKLKKYYENKKRNKCKEKPCEQCKAFSVCTEIDEVNNDIKSKFED